MTKGPAVFDSMVPGIADKWKMANSALERYIQDSQANHQEPEMRYEAKEDAMRSGNDEEVQVRLSDIDVSPGIHSDLQSVQHRTAIME
ncbi:unnamed protein product [Soboliphyme baturini]|uniref:PDEase domain-containing protein n=1 Tax=Soboliphyme baturini TaxID=241478 RepID=A0A183ICF1_9BILA|nr:unnamed protein product [Soboliphyme baturini]